MLPKFVKVFPHEYKRVLGIARQQVAVAYGERHMGKVTGFMEYTRELPQRRDPALRIKDWFEIYQPFPEDQPAHAGARAAWIAACRSATPAVR